MQISEAESRVMAILWERGEATADEVVSILRKQSDWQEPTIKTLLGRLLKKGAVTAEVEGRRYRYRPAIEQADWVLEESSHLLDRLFQGRIAPLVAQFSESGRLTRQDVEALRRLIAEIDDGE